MARRLPDTGTIVEGPALRKIRPAGYAGTPSVLEDLEFKAHPRSMTDMDIDFDGALNTFVYTMPLWSASGAASTIATANGTVVDGSVMVHRAGYLVSAQLIAEDGLAVDDTNYVTFTLVNNAQSGAGTTAMLAATDVNTTKNAAGVGVAITAETGRPLTVHGTAANLRVAAGDLLTFTATVTAGAVLANAVDKPGVRLVFATLPWQLAPLTAKTVGLLAAQPVPSTAYGEALFQLGSTNEVNTAGFYLGDQLNIPAFTSATASSSATGSGPWMECRVKVSGVAAATRMVFGFCSAYNATWDSTTQNFWFRLEGNSLALLYETDDDTTNVDDQTVGITLTADTYYLLRVDLSEPGRAKFSVDDRVYKTVSAGALTSAMLLQPICAIQKDSGTGTQSITVDRVRWGGSRF